MPKLIKVINVEGKVAFRCPGCKGTHQIYVSGDPNEHPVWKFNGDYENPTITPSINVSGRVSICHSYITNGKIEYLGDSTHELAGQTIELPEL